MESRIDRPKKENDPEYFESVKIAFEAKLIHKHEDTVLLLLTDKLTLQQKNILLNIAVGEPLEYNLINILHNYNKQSFEDFINLLIQLNQIEAYQETVQKQLHAKLLCISTKPPYDFCFGSNTLIERIAKQNLRIFFKLIHNDLLQQEDYDKFVKDNENIKLIILSYIKNGSRKKRLSELLDATNPKTGLGKFFYTQRGVKTPNLNSGCLKEIVSCIKSIINNKFNGMEIPETMLTTLYHKAFLTKEEKEIVRSHKNFSLIEAKRIDDEEAARRTSMLSGNPFSSMFHRFQIAITPAPAPQSAHDLDKGPPL